MTSDTRKIATGYARGLMGGMLIGVPTMVLFALGVLHGDLRVRDLVGKLLLQSVPVSIGASVAMSEFGEEHRVVEERRKHAGYWGTLGMALAGAMLFGFGVSATQELLLVADQLTWPRAVLLVALSLAQVHGIVYAVNFRQRPEDVGTPRHRMEVLREGVSTYALSLVVGAYLLWTFQTIDTRMAIIPAVYAIVAMGFVTSLGAAAAELLI
jgi:putative integral membrane protein (TIGR02587 family)